MSIKYSEISAFLTEAKKKKPLTTGDCDAPGVDDSVAKITEETDMRYCPKCEKMEVREECSYGPDYWDSFAIKNVSQKVEEGIVNEFVGGKPGDGYIGHPNLNIKNPLAKKQVKGPTGNKGLAGKLGDRKMRMDAMMKQLNQSFDPEGETIEEKSAAWQRSSGKNKEGGLNEKGRKSYERENPGSDLKAPQPEGGSRKKSFCARMGGMKKKLTSSKTANDPDSRINKALRKWKC